MLDDDDARLAASRAAVLETVGEAGFIDAAAVLSLFNALDRVAETTGVLLPDQVLELTADLRGELGLNDFLSAGA